VTRPDKHDIDNLTDDSWSVHGGNHADETTGAIRTPIVMANSYRLPEDPSDIDDPSYQGLVYTREHGANQRGLEEKLAKLDHGEVAAVFGTGMAALRAAFITILNPATTPSSPTSSTCASPASSPMCSPRSSGSRSTSSTSLTSTPCARPYDPTRGWCTPRSSLTLTSASPTSPPWRVSRTMPARC
jgi:cystathionine beta-lyase/cystathionine gamma-synthase